PVYKAKKLSQILYNCLKEMQTNSIKEKVKPVVYFYNENGKEIIDLSSEETPRLKDREQIVTFFRNEILAGKIVYTVQELEQIREMISRMNYIVS
ncbi:UNVERIFIED_CONTAM: NERD domain-containing protein, partial [Bacillus thuringiensis]